MRFAMFRHELSTFLREVLDEVARHEPGVFVDPCGEPDVEVVARLSASLRESPDPVRRALIGLRASECLMEHRVEFAGAEPLVWWAVHPQVRSDAGRL
jgi:hypothetical protein